MHARHDEGRHVRRHARLRQRKAKVSPLFSSQSNLIVGDLFRRGAVATLALQNQLAIAQSKELNFAIKQVKEIQKEGNHITRMLSLSDLIQLGGYAAVEYCGGPAMIFNMGRQDIGAEGDAVQHAPETHAGSLVVKGLAQSDLTPEEFVALMGSFTIGFNGEDKKGPSTRWCMNPYVFDNTYY